MIGASKYTITVRKGLFDDEEFFEARIAELPDVAEYADSFAEAYSLAIDTVETTAELFAEQGKLMPVSLTDSINLLGFKNLAGLRDLYPPTFCT